MQDRSSPPRSLFEAHSRSFAANRYVYPVLSRRAGGISIGVNLNLDKFCNFRCVYCQVEASRPRGEVVERPAEPIDLRQLADELERTVESAVSGRVFEGPQFRDTPPALRRLNDIALSGDGEPTAAGNFAEAVEFCAAVRRQRGLVDLKLVLITNGSLLDRPRVQKGLETLDRNGGEVWAKLDAGSDAYYQRVARSAVPYQRILNNLCEAAVARPIVIQSLWTRMENEPPPPAEIEAFCDRLAEIVGAGGRIKLVQVHTVARKPAEPWVKALADREVDAIAERIYSRTGLPVAAFYGG